MILFRTQRVLFRTQGRQRRGGRALQAHFLWGADHGPNPEGFISHPRLTAVWGRALQAHFLWSADHGLKPEGFISHPRQTTEMGEGAPGPLLCGAQTTVGGEPRGGTRRRNSERGLPRISTSCGAQTAVGGEPRGGTRRGDSRGLPNLESKRSRDSSRPNAP